jgi:hypothetical protein
MKNTSPIRMNEVWIGVNQQGLMILFVPFARRRGSGDYYKKIVAIFNS